MEQTRCPYVKKLPQKKGIYIQENKLFHSRTYYLDIM